MSDATCLRCDRPVDFIDGEPSMPSEAIMFSSSGNYGSGLWDEMHRIIVVYVCDTCVAEHADGGHVLEVQTSPRPAAQYIPWTRRERKEAAPTPKGEGGFR